MKESGFEGRWLGRRAYGEVFELQLRLFEARQADTIPDTVLFVEHPCTITLGRGAKAEHVLSSRGELARLGVEVFEVNRGGDVTLHAPGQLVCYPIISLPPGQRDVRRYVQRLALSMNRVIGRFGLEAGLVDGLVGLWIDPSSPAHWSTSDRSGRLAKVGAIGVRLSRWVTMHGYALNLTTDLKWFRLIVPCGIRDHDVTSVQALTGEQPELEALVEFAFDELCQVFEVAARGFTRDL